MRDQPISRVMTTPAVTIDPDATVQDAAALMVREGIHHLPVVAGGRLAGILSAADLVGSTRHNQSLAARVGDMMRREPVALHADATLEDAAQALVRGAFHSLPVVTADGTVIGVVTSTDLIILLLRQLPRGADTGGTGRLEALEAVRHAADVYLRSGQGEHEHAALVRALQRAREQSGGGTPPGRL